MWDSVPAEPGASEAEPVQRARGGAPEGERRGVDSRRERRRDTGLGPRSRRWGSVGPRSEARGPHRGWADDSICFGPQPRRGARLPAPSGEARGNRAGPSGSARFPRYHRRRRRRRPPTRNNTYLLSPVDVSLGLMLWREEG